MNHALTTTNIGTGTVHLARPGIACGAASFITENTGFEINTIRNWRQRLVRAPFWRLRKNASF
jgi:hypothetical protein